MLKRYAESIIWQTQAHQATTDDLNVTLLGKNKQTFFLILTYTQYNVVKLYFCNLTHKYMRSRVLLWDTVTLTRRGWILDSDWTVKAFSGLIFLYNRPLLGIIDRCHGQSSDHRFWTI